MTKIFQRLAFNPSASNAELKALLVKVRPAFVAHLEHAKQVQSGTH